MEGCRTPRQCDARARSIWTGIIGSRVRLSDATTEICHSTINIMRVSRNSALPRVRPLLCGTRGNEQLPGVARRYAAGEPGTAGRWGATGGHADGCGPAGSAPDSDADMASSASLSAVRVHVLARFVRDARGHTLHHFDRDSTWPTKPHCGGACLERWKPAKPVDVGKRRAWTPGWYRHQVGLHAQALGVPCAAGDRRAGDLVHRCREAR